MNLVSKSNMGHWGAVALCFALSGSVFAEDHVIKGVITQWQPLVTFAQPGDTIKFIGMSGHDTTSMEGLLPEGAETWHSKLGEEGFTVVVEKGRGKFIFAMACAPGMIRRMNRFHFNDIRALICQQHGGKGTRDNSG